ncbi:unnamed protein product [Symbiodinium natans]|uniref:PPM-type phosphatase domain-containing protein n=1 Tax=Symbiodinium natans TaxID=878477 RepID=A0A812J9I6_9DINO|nr:unnamed protein product [Symbiodinium natans]
MWWLLSHLCTCLGRDKAANLLPEEESGGGVDYGYAVAKNERARMEDAIDIREDVAGFRLFAVYDGHAGSAAVMLAKENLPRILGRYLKDAADVEGAIKAAFQAADEEVMQALLENKATADMADLQTSSGTAERLKNAGVSVEAGYVDEHVAVSRALGNVRLHTGIKVNGIMNEPEVFRVAIDDAVDFIMIGSDGIWDALKEQFALTHARKALRTTAKPEDAAVSILQNAGRVSKADNAAVVVIVFKFPEPLPKRPAVQRKSLTALQESAA